MSVHDHYIKYMDDVTWWRFWGLLLYQAVPAWIIQACLLGFSLSWSPGTAEATYSFLILILLGGVEIIPIWALKSSQVAIPPLPVALDKYVPSTFMKIPNLLPRAIGQLLGRLLDHRSGSKALTVMAAYTLTGSLFLTIFYWGRSNATANGKFGVLLGIVYASTVLARNADVLKFPLIHRHRLLRLKGRLGPVLGSAVFPWILTLAIWTSERLVNSSLHAYAAWTGKHHAAEAKGTGGSTPLLGGLAFVLSSAIGLEVYKVVYTERLDFEEDASPEGLSLLYHALSFDQDSAAQVAAFGRLYRISRGQGSSGLARRTIFSDNTGQLWKPPAEACLGELETATAVLAQGLPQPPPVADPKAGKEGPSWNQPVTAPKASLTLSVGNAYESAFQIEGRYQKLSFAISALTGFCVASRLEDQYGILQLVEPGLGSILVSMLSLIHATREHLKNASRSDRRQSTDLQASGCQGKFVAALEDLLLTSVLRVVDEFGEDLKPVVEGNRRPPQSGSKPELLEILRTLIKKGKS